MYTLVREELPRRGYPMYEISNYAPPGHEARHNLSYWRAESYLGLGAGAHSCARDDDASVRRWWNQRLPIRYIASATRAGIAEAGAETVDRKTAAGEFVFLNLRLRDGFALSEFEHRFGASFDTHFGNRSAPLFQGGLLIRTRERIFLSDRGLELADSVFAEFV
jgi:oxygen-independent coproporphyrinogen-3 oxidase